MGPRGKAAVALYPAPRLHMVLNGGYVGHLGYSPNGPCAQIVYALAPKYPCREYFKATVYAVWEHGPLGQ